MCSAEENTVCIRYLWKILIMEPNKKLGQHWLTDKKILEQIAKSAALDKGDPVLEIGPGLGTLTSVLVEKSNKVVAIEYDKNLADKLSKSELINYGLTVKNEDFLRFDLSTMPEGYKVVGNIPYYITGKIVRKILTANNQPKIAVLLVQKEVAQRLASKPGEMSILSVISQYYAEVSLGVIVSAEKFDPPPKVDSQVVILQSRTYDIGKLSSKNLEKKFLIVVKAGFSARRKKLHSSLAGGLRLSVEQAKQMLAEVNIDSNQRAQDLSIDDWLRLANRFEI